jgi:hypothetical protein
MHKATHAEPSLLNLMKGQSHTVTLRRGTVIKLAKGAVSVTSNIWLDNAVLKVHCRCGKGLFTVCL